MWKRVIWIEERIPQTIREVETRYCCKSGGKLAPPVVDRMIGGVITPASIESACWKPNKSAKKTGILSLRPKNGAARSSFFMKGRFGLKRNA